MSDLYRGMIIDPVNRFQAGFIPDGALLVADGVIRARGEYAAVARQCAGGPAPTIHDYRRKLIAPGFIDAHLHLPQLDQRARYGESLLSWLTKYIYPAEREFADPAVARAVSRRCFREMFRNGTTTVVAYSSISAAATAAAFEVADELGARACLGKVMMDQDPPGPAPEPTDQSLRESVALCEAWDGRDGGRLRYVFTPRFAPTCSRDLMREIGDYARPRNVLIQTHLAENEEETVRVLRLFPECDTYTGVYERYGLLGPRTLLAHGIHLGAAELDLLRESGARLVHCPSSNFFLKSGSIRLRAVEKQAIPLALGSDVGAGPSFSLFDVMKAMNYSQEHHLSPLTAYYYATLGGAAALGLEHVIGNFQPGKEADFIILDLYRLHPEFVIGSLEDLLAFLIYLGHDGFIERTYIRNRCVWDRTRDAGAS